MKSNSVNHVIRLKPGDDLKLELTRFVREEAINAGWIITCVGSLTNYHLRFANQQQGTTDKGYFEIVSLTGTLGKEGLHLHMSVSDRQGHVRGGHLMDGSIVYTTAEIVVGVSDEMIFKREIDIDTGWRELICKRKSPF